MRLDSIFETEKGKNDYQEVLDSLLKRFNANSIRDIKRSDVFEEVNHRQRYGTHEYHGELKKGIELSALEVAFILDKGYSFFGGSSVVNSDGTFSTEIYFD